MCSIFDHFFSCDDNQDNVSIETSIISHISEILDSQNSNKNAKLPFCFGISDFFSLAVNDGNDINKIELSIAQSIIKFEKRITSVTVNIAKKNDAIFIKINGKCVVNENRKTISFEKIIQT